MVPGSSPGGPTILLRVIARCRVSEARQPTPYWRDPPSVDEAIARSAAVRETTAPPNEHTRHDQLPAQGHERRTPVPFGHRGSGTSQCASCLGPARSLKGEWDFFGLRPVEAPRSILSRRPETTTIPGKCQGCCGFGSGLFFCAQGCPSRAHGCRPLAHGCPPEDGSGEGTSRVVPASSARASEAPIGWR